MSTWQEAELAQERCNGALMSGHEIRVSFGMPCRPGACILQHKNTVTIPFVRLKHSVCVLIHTVCVFWFNADTFEGSRIHPPSLSEGE